MSQEEKKKETRKRSSEEASSSTTSCDLGKDSAGDVVKKKMKKNVKNLPEEPRHFSGYAAKQLKAHCGAGRLDCAMNILQRHGYHRKGTIQHQHDAVNIDVLLDCAQNAARSGHLPEHARVIDVFLDLGIVPDFTLMYHATLSCCTPTLVRCAEVCLLHTRSKDVLNRITPHALEGGVAGNFLHLINDCGAILPVCLSSIKGFVHVAQPNAVVYLDPNTEGDDKLALEVRETVLRVWGEMGALDAAALECKRLHDTHAPTRIPSVMGAEQYKLALQMLKMRQIQSK